MLEFNVSPEMKFGDADFCKDTSAYDMVQFNCTTSVLFYWLQKLYLKDFEMMKRTKKYTLHLVAWVWTYRSSLTFKFLHLFI